MIFYDWVETEIIPDPFAWYQYQYGGSANHIIYDSIGEKHLIGEESNAPVLTENVIGGQPAWYFDGTKDPLVYSGSVEVKHAFILASNEDATFASYQGLLTGETTGDVLVGGSGTTKFFDLGIGNLYSKEGVSFDEDDQQAPMSGAFRLLEVKNTTGIVLDGIQVGQQRSFTARRWQGHFVEMILFDRILSRDEIRRVRLYFNIKFSEWQRGLPFYFPSADITPSVGPSRFYDVPKDYNKITDDWEYEDGTKDFNEIAGDAPMRWEYAYPAVPKAQLPIYNEFWNQARLVNTFYFKDPDGIVWDNVRIEDYNRNHQAHMRWRHDVAFRLVGYNSTGSPEAPPELPATPTGLALSVLSDSEITATWDEPPAAPDTSAPSVPVMSPGDVLSDTEIDWSWSASTDDTAVTGYDLQVAEDSGFSVGLTTYNLGDVLTYSSTGLTPSTTYYARVRAHDAVPNNSSYSSSVNATTEATGAWDPGDLPDILHWYRASDLALADNDPVSTWDDRAGTADLTSSSTARPIYKANAGDPYVEFDGVNDTISGAITLLGTNVSIVCIFERVSAPTGYTRLFEVGNPFGNRFVSFQDNMTDNQFMYYTLAGGLSRPTLAPNTGFNAMYAETLGTAGKYRINGSEVTGTNSYSSGVGSDTLYLGSNSSGAENGNHRIKEVIICSNAVTGADWTSLEAYVLAEYGLTL